MLDVVAIRYRGKMTRLEIFAIVGYTSLRTKELFSPRTIPHVLKWVKMTLLCAVWVIVTSWPFFLFANPPALRLLAESIRRLSNEG